MEDIQKAIDNRTMIYFDWFKKGDTLSVFPIGIGENDGNSFLLAVENHGQNAITIENQFNLYPILQVINVKRTDKKGLIKFNMDKAFYKKHFQILIYPIINDWED